MSSPKLIEFYRLIPQARMPKRADRSGAGYLPSRAMRYCDALTSATGYGYWIFPPITMHLRWDGERVYWSQDDAETWEPVTSTAASAIQYPAFSDEFDRHAPEYLAGYSPPFMTAMPELGGVQIWTGLLARTRPGWSLLVRQPINLPPTPGLSAWEGIVETDIWFGPLFNNFRLTQTNEPVVLRAGVPFLQVQPLPQYAYRDDNLNDYACHEVDQLGEADWRQLSKVLLPSANWEARQGEYAVTVRKRRLSPAARGCPGPEDGAAARDTSD